MIASLRSRLSVRQALLTVLAALALSAVFTVGQVIVSVSDERALVRERMAQMLAAVEGPAAQAAFEFDRRLSHDVARSMLAYEPIRGVMLSDDVGRPLVQLSSGTGAPTSGVAALLFGNLAPIVQPLSIQRPTGDTMPVGQLTVTLDPIVLSDDLLARLTDMVIADVLQNLALGLVLAFLVHLTLTKPITRLTRAIGRIDPDDPRAALAGPLPLAERNDELGDMVHGLSRTLSAFADTMIERDRVDAALRESETRFRDLIEGSVQGVAILSYGRIVFANDALARMAGLDGSAELTAVANAMDLFHSEDRDTLSAAIHATLRSGEDSGAIRCRALNQDGREIWLLASLRRIDWFGGHAVQAILVDTTEQVRAEQQLLTMATRDPLTHLANRTLITERLEHAVGLARHEDRQVALIYTDLDRFKLINDTFGHDIGDQLLWAVSRRLRPLAGEGCTLARLGGDEFVMLMELDVTAATTAEKAQAILDAFRQPVALSGRQIIVTPSIGISIFGVDAPDAKACMRNADIAMYVAKGAGGNCFHFFTADMNDRATRRLEMESDLRDALKSHQFELYYQPKFRATDLAPIGLEALLRWRHPERGWVSPAEFVPVAEETGLIAAIGERVINEACRQAADWLDRFGVALPVAVNVSPRQLSDRHLTTMIANTLAQYRLDPKYLEVEVTESAAMQNIDAVTPLLRDLRSIGIAVTIDDFGTGYSSLSYLKRLPIACLKLDRSFVTDLPGDADDATISSAVISLGHELGLAVVAEGVETEEQLAFLRDRHCDYLQGFLFSKPLPALDITDRYIKPLAAAKPTEGHRERFTVIPGSGGLTG